MLQEQLKPEEVKNNKATETALIRRECFAEKAKAWTVQYSLTLAV
jgi:hypothetical protein